MIKEENYPNAYKEVYVILQNFDKSEFKLIPKSFINMLENNMNREYNFELDDDFDKQELLQETKTILSYVYLNYLGTKEEKAKIKQKFKQDILKDEEEKRLKYNSNELFNRKRDNSNDLLKREETQLEKYRKENFFIKIIKKIKNLFKRK